MSQNVTKCHGKKGSFWLAPEVPLGSRDLPRKEVSQNVPECPRFQKIVIQSVPLGSRDLPLRPSLGR